MKTAIYIKSFPKDFPWLAYCLRSIEKFATGFSEVVVEIPIGSRLPLTKERVVYSKEYGNGYLLQQARKMYADKHVPTADHILFIDSDAVFNQPVTPESFMTDGKVNWLMTPRAQLEKAVPWFPVMQAFLGRRPEFEFMRCLPCVIPAWLPQEIRAFCRSKHRVELEQYIMSKKEFTEFNVFGHYLWEFHRDRIHWINTDDGTPAPKILQHWSWGGLTPAIKKTLDGLLYPRKEGTP